MRASISLVTLIASAGLCGGQLISERFFAGLRGFGLSPVASTASYMSSVSFEKGIDGEMHKHVHQVSTENVQDGMAMKKSRTEMICKDGNCQKQSLRGSSSWVPLSDGSLHKTVHRERTQTFVVNDAVQHKAQSRLDCLDGLCREQTSRFGQLGYTAAVIPMRLHRFVQRIMGTGAYAVGWPGLAHTQTPVHQPPHFLFKYLPRSLRHSAAPAPVAMVAVAGEPQQAQAVAPRVQEAQLAEELFALYFFAASFFSSALLAAAALKCLGRRSEAREAFLGEPLFDSATEASMVTGPARVAPIQEKRLPLEKEPSAAALAAAKAYLPDLYLKASSLADAQLVRAYLTRVYTAQA